MPTINTTASSEMGTPLASDPQAAPATPNGQQLDDKGARGNDPMIDVVKQEEKAGMVDGSRATPGANPGIDTTATTPSQSAGMANGGAAGEGMSPGSSD